MGMTKEEFKILVKGLKSVYTLERFIPDQDAFNVWYMLLSDLDYDIAGKAIQKHMMVSSTIPTPADIRKTAYDILQGRNELTEAAAWGLIKQAIRNSTYNAAKEFAELPAIVQVAVGSPAQLRTWAMDEKFNENVAFSNFNKVFQSVKERERQDGIISTNLKLSIDEISNRYLTG